MRKTFALAFAMLAMALSANATVRPAHKLYHVGQSDGTTIMLYKNGNGYLAYYTTADDQIVVRNAAGTLCYAKLVDGKLVATDIVVHNINERTAQEIAFVAQNTLKPSDADVKIAEAGPKKISTKSTITSGDYGMGIYGVSAKGSVPSIGEVKIPVIMTEFADESFQPATTPEKLTKQLNAEGYNEDNDLQRGSVRDYFLSQSNGMFSPQFEVVAVVKLSRQYAYYGANTAGLDSNAKLCVKEAVKLAADQGVDFSKYVVNGKIPNVIIYYAGLGEATGGDENRLWPHEADFNVLDQANILSDYKFSSYFVGNELDGDGSALKPKIMGMGVLVHEFSHAMGLPDFYNTSSSSSSDPSSPMGQWDVMNSGPYVNDSYAPMGYTAYERCYMGWLKIKELTGAESIVLNPLSSAEGNCAVKIVNPNSPYEYFILENRQGDTWYPFEFGDGLLLHRYVYDESAWKNNYVNIYANSRRAIVLPASGRGIKNSGFPADLYGNGVNLIESLPLVAGNSYTGMPIYKILKRADGTISFNVADRTLDAEPIVGDDVYEKVTDASVLSANDKVLFVSEADNIAFSSEFASSKVQPVGVKIEDGKVYGNDLVNPLNLLKTADGSSFGFRTDKNAYLSVNNLGVQYLSKSSNACLASLTFTDGNVAVKFNTNTANKYLVYDTNNYIFSSSNAATPLQLYRKSISDGINTIPAAGVEATGRVYNLAGQQVDASYKGIVIINGKKVLRK